MSTPPPRDERLERIVERIYVGVRASQQSAPETLLRQVQTVAQGLAEEGEQVEVGFLAND